MAGEHTLAEPRRNFKDQGHYGKVKGQIKVTLR